MGWEVSNLALIMYAIAMSYNVKMVITLTTKKTQLIAQLQQLNLNSEITKKSSYPSAQFCPKC